MEERGFLRHTRRLLHGVGHDHHAETFAQLVNQLFNLCRRNRIQRRTGFIHQQDFRFCRYCTRNAQTLLLSTGQAGSRRIQAIFHLIPDRTATQGFFNDFIQFRFVLRQAMNARAIGHIVINGFWERVWLLKHHADFRPQLHRIHFRVIDVFTIQQNVTLHPADVDCVIHPVQGAQECGLAAA